MISKKIEGRIKNQIVNNKLPQLHSDLKNFALVKICCCALNIDKNWLDRTFLKGPYM